MRIYVGFDNQWIYQVDRNPQLNLTAHEEHHTPQDGVPINGKYVIPVVQGVEFPVDVYSHVVRDVGFGDVIDGDSVVSQSYAHLLAKYPLYETIYFNPLILPSHVNELDLTATFSSEYTDQSGLPPVALPTRAQTGRYGGVDGQMPTHTALLPENRTATPYHPGILITKNIDISAYTLGPDGITPIGTDEFCVYWQLVGFTVSDDIASDYGIHAGVNTPVIRRVVDVPQEPTSSEMSDGMEVYMSPDDGLHWCLVNFLEPINFRDKTTSFRLAFVNYSDTDKIYLASFAVMF